MNTNRKQHAILISPCSFLLLQAFITLCLTLVLTFYISTLKRQFTITTNENNAFSIMIIAFLMYVFLNQLHWNKIKKKGKNNKFSWNPVTWNLSSDNVRGIESIETQYQDS